MLPLHFYSRLPMQLKEKSTQSFFLPPFGTLMHQDALHELMENFRRQLLNIQVTIHDLQELIHSLNVFLLILQFRFHLWDVRFTLLLLCMARNPLCC